MKDNLLERFRSIDPTSKIILLLLLVFLVRGMIYATVVPLWQAPDEPEHFIRIQNIAAEYSPGLREKLNPDSYGTGYVSIYFNALAILYLLLLKQDIMISVYLLRLATLVLGTVTVYLTYRIAREIFPENRLIMLGSPIFIAFMPMFTYISAMINPDNLANVIFALFLLCSILTIRRGVNFWYVLGLVAASVIGFYTKRTTFFSLLLLILLPVFIALRTRLSKSGWQWRRFGLISAYLALLAFSPYVFMIAAPRFAGRTISLDLFRKILSPSFLLEHVFAVFRPENIFFKSFWGVFGWLSVSISPSFYNLAFVVSLISLAGLAVYFLRRLFDDRIGLKDEDERTRLLSLVFLLISAFVSAAATLAFIIFLDDPQWIQGRWVFTTLPAMAVLFVTGLGIHFPQDKTRPVLTTLLVNMFLFDSVCIFGYLIPAFYGSFTDFAHPKNLIFGTNIPIARYAEFSEKPSLLSHNYPYYLLFAFYLVLFIVFVYSQFRMNAAVSNDPDR